MKPNISRMQRMNAPDTASVQRNVVLRVNSGRRTKDETLTAYTMDHRLLVCCVDLSPQPTHVHVNEIALRHEFIVPDLLEQHGASQQLILSTHHVFKQAKLARQQIDRAIATFGGARQQIELEWSNTQCGITVFRGAAQ